MHIPGKIEMAELNELPVLMGDKLKNQADLLVNKSLHWFKLEDQLISIINSMGKSASQEAMKTNL